MTAAALAREAQTVLVVEEGAARLRWSGGGLNWRLVGMWPDAGERRSLAEDLKADRPVLIVLSAVTSVVPVWRSELQIPERSFESVNPEGDLLELTMPFLEWLPAQLRERGREFSEQAWQLIQRTPAPLLPGLIIEEPAEREGRVRFAQRTRQKPPTAEELSRVASWVFDTARAA